MIDYLTGFEFISFLALFVYWIPAAICISVYCIRFVAMYQNDLSKSKEEYYRPELTIGLIIWFIGCALIPGVNLFALVFDCASSVFKWLGSVLNIPLVPKRAK